MFTSPHADWQKVSDMSLCLKDLVRQRFISSLLYPELDDRNSSRKKNHLFHSVDEQKSWDHQFRDRYCVSNQYINYPIIYIIVDHKSRCKFKSQRPWLLFLFQRKRALIPPELAAAMGNRNHMVVIWSMPIWDSTSQHNYVDHNHWSSASAWNPVSCNDHFPLCIIRLRRVELIFLVRVSEIMFWPATHRTCPPERAKSLFRMLRSIAVLLSSMWAEEFRHLVIVSKRDRESVTAMNGIFLRCCSQSCSPGTVAKVSHSMNLCQWTWPIPWIMDRHSAERVLTVHRLIL